MAYITTYFLMSSIVLSLLLSIMSTPCLGNNVFGINDLFVLTWINWLCDRYLRLQGFSSPQNLKSRQYEHLLTADNLLKAMAKCSACSLHPPRTDPGVDAWRLSVLLLFLPSQQMSPKMCWCPAKRMCQIILWRYILPNLHDAQIWCIAFRLFFSLVLCTAKHEFYKY